MTISNFLRSTLDDFFDSKVKINPSQREEKSDKQSQESSVRNWNSLGLRVALNSSTKAD